MYLMNSKMDQKQNLETSCVTSQCLRSCTLSPLARWAHFSNLSFISTSEEISEIQIKMASTIYSDKLLRGSVRFLRLSAQIRLQGAVLESIL